MAAGFVVVAGVAGVVGVAADAVVEGVAGVVGVAAGGAAVVAGVVGVAAVLQTVMRETGSGALVCSVALTDVAGACFGAHGALRVVDAFVGSVVVGHAACPSQGVGSADHMAVEGHHAVIALSASDLAYHHPCCRPCCRLAHRIYCRNR